MRRRRMWCRSQRGALMLWISTGRPAAYSCFDVAKPVELLRGRKACWETRRRQPADLMGRRLHATLISVLSRPRRSILLAQPGAGLRTEAATDTSRLSNRLRAEWPTARRSIPTWPAVTATTAANLFPKNKKKAVLLLHSLAYWSVRYCYILMF